MRFISVFLYIFIRNQVKEVDSSEFLLATVENLKEGKPYLFRVYAENEVGAGPATELRDSVIPRSSLGKDWIYWNKK